MPDLKTISKALCIPVILAMCIHSMAALAGMGMIMAVILIHEAGHFLAAKWVGIPIDVFSVGFGSRLVGFEWHGTDFRLSVFPLGGYVRERRPFQGRPSPRRIVFDLGGVLANLLTGFMILFVVHVDYSLITGFKPAPAPLRFSMVAKDGPAAKAGFHAGDDILNVGPYAYPGSDPNAAAAFLQAHPGTPVPITFSRAGVVLHSSLTMVGNPGHAKGGFSIIAPGAQPVRRALRAGDLLPGAATAAGDVVHMISAGAKGLGQLFMGHVHESGVVGPVGAFQDGQEAARHGLLTFFLQMAGISVGLSITNLIPLPFLDGGLVIFDLWAIRRKRRFRPSVRTRIANYWFLGVAAVVGIVVYFGRIGH